MQYSLLVFLTACIAVSGCKDSISQIDGVATVEVSPPSMTLVPGQSFAFTATALDSDRNFVNATPITWKVEDDNIASVNDDGVVTAVAVGTTVLSAAVSGKEGKASVNVVPSQGTGNGDIVINGGVRHQTMLGWEATAWAGQWGCGETGGSFPSVFHRYKQELYQRLVNEMGINRLRLELRAGAENPRDWFGDFQNRTIDFDVFNDHWYETVNDNSDPNSIHSAGFHFTELDFTIENVVNPVRQLLQARGEQLYVNMNVVQFGQQYMLLRDQPEEYAEFVLAAFQHIQSKYGWVPDALEIVLEPDNNNRWTGTQVGRAVAAAGARLAAAGFHPDIIAPAVAHMYNATNFFDAIIAVSGARQYVKELSYHRYGTENMSDLQEIGQYAGQYGVRTAMLERIGSGYEDLHDDLEVGRNSAWSQYAIGGCGLNDPGGRHYLIDATPNSTTYDIVLARRSHFLRLYFLYVRRGAVRVGVTSSVSALDPLAFVNTNGRYTVVVKASGARNFGIDGLPPGDYGVIYTTGPEDQPGASGIRPPDIHIAAGQTLETAIPARGIITIYGK